MKSNQNYNITPSLNNIKILMELLGNPHKKLKYIHVAGTNAKGSTCSYINEILIDAGYKVGLFTSPHLIKINERFKINNIDIVDADLNRLSNIVEDTIRTKENFNPSFFEKICAVSFLYFLENKCDFCIMEVGLGGRFDATNIIENSEVSVITPIGLDHIKILGNNVEKIAFEKAGIIKSNSNIISAKQEKNVLDILNLVSKNKNATLKYIDENDIKDISLSFYYSTFKYKSNEYRISLMGKTQIYNSILAIEAVNILSKKYKISKDNIKNGLINTYLPARIEVLSKEPLFIIDVAHNNHSASNILNSVIDIIDRKIIFVLGFNREKDYNDILKTIKPFSKVVIATEPICDNALKTDELYDTLKNMDIISKKSKNITNAIDLALDIADKDDVIFCFGSFYLVGYIKEIFIKKSNNF